MFGASAVIGRLVTHFSAKTDDFDKAISHIERRVSKLSTAFTSIGSRMSLGLTVPLVGFAKQAIDSFATFNQNMTEAAAVFGGLSDEMRMELEKTATALSKTTVHSAQELAKAYVDLARAGLQPVDAMERLEAVALASQAGAVDIKETVDLLTTSFSALTGNVEMTGDAVHDFSKMVDLLVQGSIMSEAEITDFATALTRRVGGALRITGRSMSEGIAILSVFAKTGLKGAIAAERMNMVLRDLHRAQVANQEAWDAVGIATEDAMGKVLPFADILETFEKKLEGLELKQKRAALLQLGFQNRSVDATIGLIGLSDHIRIYQKEIEKAGGVTKKVADDQLQSFSNQLKLIRDILDEFVRQVGSSVAPVLLAVGTGFAVLTKAFMSLPSGLRIITGLFVTFVAALGPAIYMLGQFIFFGKQVWEVLKVWKIHQLSQSVATKMSTKAVQKNTAAVAGNTSFLVNWLKANNASTASLQKWLMANNASANRVKTFLKTGGKYVNRLDQITGEIKRVVLWTLKWFHTDVRIIAVKLKDASVTALLAAKTKLYTIAARLSWRATLLLKTAQRLLTLQNLKAVAVMTMLRTRTLLSTVAMKAFAAATWSATFALKALKVAAWSLAKWTLILIPVLVLLDLIGDAVMFITDGISNWVRSKLGLKSSAESIADEVSGAVEELKGAMEGDFNLGEGVGIDAGSISVELEEAIKDATRQSDFLTYGLKEVEKELIAIDHVIADFKENAAGMNLDDKIEELRKLLTDNAITVAGNELIDVFASLDRQIQLADPSLSSLEREMMTLDHSMQDIIAVSKLSVDELNRLKLAFDDLKNSKASEVFNDIESSMLDMIESTDQALRILAGGNEQAIEDANILKAFQRQIDDLADSKKDVTQLELQLARLKERLRRKAGTEFLKGIKDDIESAFQSIRTPKEILDDTLADLEHWRNVIGDTITPDIEEKLNRLSQDAFKKFKESADKNLDISKSLKMPDALESGSNAALRRLQEFSMAMGGGLGPKGQPKLPGSGGQLGGLTPEQRRQLTLQNGFPDLFGAADPFGKIGQAGKKSLPGFSQTTGAGAARVQAAMEGRAAAEAEPGAWDLKIQEEQAERLEESAEAQRRMVELLELIESKGGFTF